MNPIQAEENLLKPTSRRVLVAFNPLEPDGTRANPVPRASHDDWVSDRQGKPDEEEEDQEEEEDEKTR